MSIIKIEHLAKSFDQEKAVLFDVNLEINKGEAVTIVGPSGCGKSTLLRLILGLIPVDQGHIYIEGIDVTKLSEIEMNRIRKKFGMVFQSSALFDSLTVGDNVGFPLKESAQYSDSRIKRLVSEKLALVGLPGIEDLMPSELSGGMRKRVSFAQAIIGEPEILLYDEPTTGLDPVMSTMIEDVIIKLRKELNITSIIVTHQPSTIFRASERIVMLHNGKVIEIGSPEQALKMDNPVVREFIDLGLMVTERVICDNNNVNNNHDLGMFNNNRGVNL
ncbi:MAG: ABC transporter ATP-binding protein [Candidatus Margulisbacteria bacterium]|nr:ABC transporter ATP-binding protein [Candidatus Margulisiibacteriota bacterium]